MNQNASFDALQDAVIRPGIEKHLVPLLLYRGALFPGRAHRMWNFTLAMMLNGAETFSEAAKLSNNPEVPHLCEPRETVRVRSIHGFFNRLRDNANVTDNYPGLTRFVRDVFKASGPRFAPWQLERVPEIGFGDIAPWRIQRPPLPRGRRPMSQDERDRRHAERLEARRKARDAQGDGRASLFYPFLIHRPKNDGDSFDLLVAVNNAVPKSLPEHIRADVCQDLVVAVLTGEIDRSELQDSARGFLTKVFRMSDMKYGSMSLHAPVPWDPDGRTLSEII